MYQRMTAAFLIAALSSGVAFGHGDSHARKPAKKSTSTKNEETDFGRPGDAKMASQTIVVGMDDSMHFTPGDLRLRQGDTVKFVVGNIGKVMHEMVIGTLKELKAHAELMKKHPGMEHERLSHPRASRGRHDRENHR